MTITMLETTGKTAENINEWLNNLILEPEIIASTPAAKAINSDFSFIDAQNLNRYKVLHAKYSDTFLNIYASNRDGEYHTVKKDEKGYSLAVGNIRIQDHFHAIMSGGQPLITSPLLSKITSIPTIFIIAPIKDEKQRPLGLIGMEISLEYVQKIAGKLKTGQTGYGIIVAQDGTFIYHPNPEFIMQKKITDQDSGIVGEIGGQMLSGDSGMQHYMFNGVKKVAFYQPIPLAGWSVATVVPEAELFAPAAQMIKLLAIITLVILLLVSITIFMVAHRLTQPLRELALHAEGVAAGNVFAGYLEVKSHDEIGQLAANFNNITTQLAKRDAEIYKTYNELEVRVLERTASLSEGNYSLHREIEERKCVEEALRAERSLFMGGPTMVFLCRNAEGWPVEYVSPNVDQILGYTVDDFLSGKVSVESTVCSEDFERITAEICMHTKKQTEFFEQEYRIRTASGEMRWFLSFTVLKRNLSGEVSHYHGYVNDITERKLMEDRLTHMDRLNAIGEVAAGIGHEIRNPMTTVRGYLQLFQRKNEFIGYQDQVNAMIKELDQANAIITEFLSLAKNKPVNKKNDNLNNVIQDLLPMMQEEVFQKGHQLQTELSDIPDNAFDEKEIRQLILNMVRNGIEAMKYSGLVTIKTYSENGNILLVIQDTGSGIPEKILSKLGTPFLTTKENGTGLGLSICYRIAARHDAVIKVDSGANGTRFTVIFAALPAGKTINTWD